MSEPANASMASSCPEVSVVIRSYNRGKRLLRAIDSALAQTFGSFEVLVVDDGSDDGSADEVTRRYGHLPQLRLIALSVNQGAAAAANVGVGEARGRYVAFLDSDDEWLASFLERHVAALRANPGAVLSYCDYLRVFDEFEMEQPIRSWGVQHARREFLQGGFIHTMSLTVTLRDAIIAVGGLDDEYAISHDYDLWLSLALTVSRPFVHIGAPLVRHRISLDGVTTHSQRWLEEYEDAMARGFRHPAAKSFADEQPEARRRIALGIVARRQLARWVSEPAQRSVSVVLTVPPESRGLMTALDSALSQDVADLEVIVVCDDAEQQAALRDIEARDDPRVRLARFESPGPPGRLINAGIRAATGELVAFLDADDHWRSGYLQCHLRAHSVMLPVPAFTVSRWSIEGGDTDPHTSFWPEHSSDLMAHALLSGFPGPLSTVVVSRARLNDLGGADESLAVDAERDLILRLLAEVDDKGRPAAETLSPVQIAKPLVACGGGEKRRRERAELRGVYAFDVHRRVWSTPVGREYVFLRNETVTRYLARRLS